MPHPRSFTRTMGIGYTQFPLHVLKEIPTRGPAAPRIPPPPWSNRREGNAHALLKLCICHVGLQSIVILIKLLHFVSYGLFINLFRRTISARTACIPLV